MEKLVFSQEDESMFYPKETLKIHLTKNGPNSVLSGTSKGAILKLIFIRF